MDIERYLVGKRLYLIFSRLQDVEEKLQAIRKVVQEATRAPPSPLPPVHLDLNEWNMRRQHCQNVLESLVESFQILDLKDLEIVHDEANLTNDDKDDFLQLLEKLVTLPSCRLKLSCRFFEGLNESESYRILSAVAASRFFCNVELWLSSSRGLSENRETGASLLLEYHGRSHKKGTLKLGSSRNATKLLILLVRKSTVESLQAPLLRESLDRNESEQLQEALVSNQTLRSLRLFLNQSNQPAANNASVAIFRALQTNCTLKRLAVHPASMELLIETLPKMKGIEALRVAVGDSIFKENKSRREIPQQVIDNLVKVSVILLNSVLATL